MTLGGRYEISPPTISASGSGGCGAVGTPVEIIQKLDTEINAVLSDPDVRSRYASLGSASNPGSSADFGKLIAAEIEKWATVIKFAGVEPECCCNPGNIIATRI
jgi:tripartite-type tricarboxylate transporter receptor subunit TctC